MKLIKSFCRNLISWKWNFATCKVAESHKKLPKFESRIFVSSLSKKATLLIASIFSRTLKTAKWTSPSHSKKLLFCFDSGNHSKSKIRRKTKIVEEMFLSSLLLCFASFLGTIFYVCWNKILKIENLFEFHCS